PRTFRRPCLVRSISPPRPRRPTPKSLQGAPRRLKPGRANRPERRKYMSLRRALGTLVILLAVLTTLPIAPAQAGPPPAAPAPCPWAGIYPTVLTPFCDGGVDTAALEREVRYQLRGGVHGLLLLGTFGEGQYVTPEERTQVVATAVRVAGPHVPVIVGI